MDIRESWVLNVQELAIIGQDCCKPKIFFKKFIHMHGASHPKLMCESGAFIHSLNKYVLRSLLCQALFQVLGRL